MFASQCIKNLLFTSKIRAKQFSFSSAFKFRKPQQDVEESTAPDDLIEKDEEYNDLVRRYLGESDHQSCYIIHPYVKWGHRKIRDTNPTLQLEEAVALIRTLHSWKVVDTTATPLDNLTKKTIFGSGTLMDLQKRIRGNPDITAVFINKGKLSNGQIDELEKAFGVPILDRYKIVMQILRLHATSKHAKLQVALAELPYLQSRLRRRDSQCITSDDYDTRKLMLQNREQKLKAAVRKLRSHRQLLRNRRNKIDYPIIAVVGYTNAGKTSLIKALTHEETLQPQNKLFATLDITLHAGYLPSNLEVLYVDTVGFISDIPTDLMECFVATLEDAMFADIILHVEDLSSGCLIHQRNHVLSTVQNLAQKMDAKDVLDKIITVGNKSDIASSNPDDTLIKISSKTGLGIDTLRWKLEDEVIKRTGRLVLSIAVPIGSEEVRWLYKNAAVVSEKEDASNTQNQILKIIITESMLHQFKSKFIT